MDCTSGELRPLGAASLTSQHPSCAQSSPATWVARFDSDCTPDVEARQRSNPPAEVGCVVRSIKRQNHPAGKPTERTL